MDNPPLLGYSDVMSVRPGGAVGFKVSSQGDAGFEARLVRSISADPNPAGPGIIETDASQWFAPQSVTGRNQPFAAGSYAICATPLDLTEGFHIRISLRIYPTLINDKVQTILSLPDVSIDLQSGGRISMRYHDHVIVSDHPLKPRRWYNVQADIRPGDDQTLIVTDIHATNTQTISGPISGDIKAGILTIAASQSRKDHFNGKVEAPKITVDEAVFVAWDFANDTTTTHIHGTPGPALSLINFPTRAMTGAYWDGSEMCWRHKPAHYGAIHFHDDDIYDFGWETDFKFTVPNDMPSGVYLMRIDNDQGSDAIPFYVCSPLGQRRADLCIVVPTFTYKVYGNHARPDYQPSWQDRNLDWNAYPYNPAEYPHYGLSTYNYHSDGSGICHASHRRPLFNMRPGYVTFGNTSCSGLRHFQADSHLISWLHHKKIAYDIITDEELHIDGVAAVDGYRAVMTMTHPEYHTSETLTALQSYRDGGGALVYLGGNGFYWRVAKHTEAPDMLEIRRAEDGIRAWAAEPGEYYNAFDGAYGGLWRRNGRPPQKLVGVGFTAQGEFHGAPYTRKNFDTKYDWIFEGIKGDVIGDFGFSGNGAAGFELDRVDPSLGTPEGTVVLASYSGQSDGFMLVPEEQLTHLTNLSGGPMADALHADMIYTDMPGGGKIFSVGSITFCGSLPWNGYDNPVSRLLENVVSGVLNKTDERLPEQK
ncbi:N,N-dimethylformamidase beta subunit family domain-containing protein [Parasulfitobacter algicola]|uniref:N,N-dimethylformamidase large subunit n=1 Tax=Parasulfitobacter algicola TaxID=2614809 RepID=A0ABX2IVA7_9RHOB|nr:N,N-dimethylformamidase beta subunit family domain-containing protein [Sulfitobacter algicola]NSX56852.1 N,N-dimethylformamidase large subunit [Sulfitobacter algicola]